MCRKSIYLRSRHGSTIAISICATIVHPVISEATEIGVSKHAQPTTKRLSKVFPKPETGIAKERHEPPFLPREIQRRHKFLTSIIGITTERISPSAFCHGCSKAGILLALREICGKRLEM